MSPEGPSTPAVRVARPAELDLATAYAILRLRSEVFVVEQECVYADLDGRDLEPGCLWLWASDDAGVVATLRVLAEAGRVRRIGRVATAARARGQGLAARLMDRALEVIGDAPSVLAAQSHLEHWYARFGYVADGPRFVEDGIPHTPMRRDAAATTA